MRNKLNNILQCSPPVLVKPQKDERILRQKLIMTLMGTTERERERDYEVRGQMASEA